MNKAELVEALEERLGGKKQATTAVEAVIETITLAVAKGDKVAISGFGTFEKQVRNARTGRNPRTGEAVKIKKTSVPRFRPGTAFKEVVSDSKAMRAYAANLKEKNGTASTRKAAPAKTATAPAVAARATSARSTTAGRAASGRSGVTATRAAASGAATARTGASKTAATKTAATKTAATKTASKSAPTRRTAKKA